MIEKSHQTVYVTTINEWEDKPWVQLTPNISFQLLMNEPDNDIVSIKKTMPLIRCFPRSEKLCKRLWRSLFESLLFHCVKVVYCLKKRVIKFQRIFETRKEKNYYWKHREISLCMSFIENWFHYEKGIKRKNLRCSGKIKKCVIRYACSS